MSAPGAIWVLFKLTPTALFAGVALTVVFAPCSSVSTKRDERLCQQTPKIWHRDHRLFLLWQLFLFFGDTLSIACSFTNLGMSHIAFRFQKTKN